MLYLKKKACTVHHYCACMWTAISKRKSPVILLEKSSLLILSCYLIIQELYRRAKLAMWGERQMLTSLQKYQHLNNNARINTPMVFWGISIEEHLNGILFKWLSEPWSHQTIENLSSEMPSISHKHWSKRNELYCRFQLNAVDRIKL